MKEMKKVDYYGNLNEVTPTTLLALIYYLGVPNDKSTIEGVFKDKLNFKYKTDK